MYKLTNKMSVLKNVRISTESKQMISIITPTYNHNSFIGECIESVLAQTHTDWEMIIIDDGSTDGTGEIVKRYKDKRIKYIRQDNMGVDRLAETYNRALSEAKGEFIAILEGDDCWPDYKLKTQIEDFRDEGVVLSFGYTQVISDDGKPLGKIPLTKLPEEAFTNSPVGRASLYMMNPFILTYIFPISVVLRREAIERIGGFQQFQHLPLVDYPTFLHLTAEGRFTFHQEVLGYWRRHSQSTTRNRFPQILDGVEMYIPEFLEKKKSALPLSKKDFDSLEKKWEELKAYQIFMLGRWCLVDKDWRNARKAFKKMVRSSSKLHFIASWLGIACSYLHYDIEFLMRYLGMETIGRLLSGESPVDMPVTKDKLKELNTN